jgi:cation transport ATPase
LFFGLALNVAALALASTGILSPMLGALVHNAGSVVIVSNSARLAAFRGARREKAATATSESPADDFTSRAA